MSILSFLRNKFRLKYQPLVEIKVFKDALLHNLHEYQTKYPNVQFAPVLKSNAYGHGAISVAKILDREEIPFFMADSFYEALVLRNAGIRSKILVLGYATLEQINNSTLKDVSFTVIDLEQLKNIVAKLNHPTALHLKVDTGMHRQGILPMDLEEALTLIRSNSNIRLEGICSHFADADGVDETFTKSQIKTWNDAVLKVKMNFPSIEYIHISNTAGSAYITEIEQNVSRLGIGLYGFNTSPRTSLNLKPALEMVSMITSIKSIPKGAKVGYNAIYTAPRETKVATVPVGYNEGLDPRLSNKGYVKISGQLCPIVGRISMNMCSVDVTEVKDIQLEDKVIVISSNSADPNSIDGIIKICGGIRYEVPVRLPQHLRRTIV